MKQCHSFVSEIYQSVNIIWRLIGVVLAFVVFGDRFSTLRS